MASAALLGLAQAAPGDFPTTVLNTEEFNKWVIDEKPYEGKLNNIPPHANL